jgi:hypothetical protein
MYFVGVTSYHLHCNFEGHWANSLRTKIASIARLRAGATPNSASSLHESATQSPRSGGGETDEVCPPRLLCGSSCQDGAGSSGGLPCQRRADVRPVLAGGGDTSAQNALIKSMESGCFRPRSFSESQVVLPPTYSQGLVCTKSQSISRCSDSASLAFDETGKLPACTCS